MSSEEASPSHLVWRSKTCLISLVQWNCASGCDRILKWRAEKLSAKKKAPRTCCQSTMLADSLTLCVWLGATWRWCNEEEHIEKKGCAQTYSGQLVEQAARGESCDSVIERFVPFEGRRPFVRPNACFNPITYYLDKLLKTNWFS